MLPVNMAYAQSATEMLDPVKLAQTQAEVDTSPFVIYDVTKGKYVAQGGTAGVRCVLAESGSVFELSGSNIKTSYSTASYLGNGTDGKLVVNLTTAATWIFNAADITNSRLYKLQCGGKYLEADANGNLTFVSSGGDTFVLISRAKLRSSIRSMCNNNMIDVTALIDNSRFEQKDGGKTEDKSGWTFSINGKSMGYRWAHDTGIDRPKTGDFYHLVGVYDAENQQVKLYRDGVLVATNEAKGKYMFPKSREYQWFVIGGEPGLFDGTESVGGRQGMPGHNVITRLYSKVMTDDDVKSLYDEMKYPSTFDEIMVKKTSNDGVLVSGVSYANNILAKQGNVLPIYGSGFQSGDEIFLSYGNTMVSNAKGRSASAKAVEGGTTEVDAKNGRALFTMPDVNSGLYMLSVRRGDKIQELGNINIIRSSTILIPAIAHRGAYGSGDKENSRESLKEALKNNYYGSETDVWMTKGGRLMVNHNPDRNGDPIRELTYAQCKDFTIGNGETMPTLDDFLKIMQETTSPTKLIIEIKEAKKITGESESARIQYNKNAAEKTVELVKQYGVEDKVEYISFSWEACLKVHALDPDAKVAFLSSNNGEDDIKTPSEVAAAGLTGIDYERGLMKTNMSWYREAHMLGLSVNVWTISTETQAKTEINNGADFFTANNPSEVKALFESNQAYSEYYNLNNK